ncbi:MAG: ABC transporter ATP-binding protein [Bdellovibrionota bacterium]|nr:ABC transporter ATP-binding protein [Bdellovibrionota bacterium]
MHIKLNQDNFIQNASLEIDIKLDTGMSVLLFGENGVGKSSLLQLLKLKQKDIFPNKVCRFIDQPKLMPLNEINFVQMREQLKSYRSEESPLFDEFYPYVEGYDLTPLKKLSGGQNQMVKILFSLYLGGDIFFFDEPVQNLDDQNTKNFACVLEGLKLKGKSCLVIEHQSEIVRKLCQKTYQLVNEDHTIKSRLYV